MRCWPLMALVLLACDLRTPSARPLAFEIIAQHPHDPLAFTQGLQWHGDRLWESTGLYGKSSVREVNRETGEVIRRRDFPKHYFGEGLTVHGDHLWMLTWRERTVFVLDPETFEEVRTHAYPGEGWGLTSDGRHLIMSDGTSTLRFMSPDDFSEVRRVTVTENGKPLINLNELEYVDGAVYANIFMTDRIVRIDPRRGVVTASLDASPLRAALPRPNRAEVLNGIAYDAATGHFLVTGKYWPSLFVIRLVE